MKYYETNGVKVIECQPEEFSVVLMNKQKKNITTASTYVNANFFAANQKLNGESFTLPVNHLVCDYEIASVGCDKANKMRGKFIGGKYYFDSYNCGNPGDQFYHKTLTVFMIKNGKPKIEDMSNMDYDLTYAVAGIPIMKNGNDVKWISYVKPQGWTGGELYGTYHIFIGLKPNSNTIYIMNWKSSTSNMIYSAEAYKKFKSMGFSDVVKLDGGGSTIMKYNGSVKQATLENRKINAIIKVTGKDTKIPSTTPVKTPANTSLNPYKMPTRALRRGMKGEDVKWLQFQLAKAGFDPSGIDGSFGNGCYRAVIAYQKARGLAVDGSVGPATRSYLAKE